MSDAADRQHSRDETLRLFLCGDVMPGRGIDQILPTPSSPELYEPYVRDARDYVALAETRSGAIARPVHHAYIWGDALAEFAEQAPDLRLVNLETSVTTSPQPWPDKGIHYRMHPANVPCLTAAGLDCCVLANNHVLDWGYGDLSETLSALREAGIATVGAGENLAEAQQPAVFELPGGGRLLVFAFADASSGVPSAWAATPTRAGVNLLPDLSGATAKQVAARVAALKRPGDLAIASIHWGRNWGYQIPVAQQDFAHALIDHGRIDLVHGHSAHHPRPIEVYGGRLILYGCGDFLNDYEGISGHEAFRSDLVLMYFPLLHRNDGRLLSLTMRPLQLRRLRLQRAEPDDVRWLAALLSQASSVFGTTVVLQGDGRLALQWQPASPAQP